MNKVLGLLFIINIILTTINFGQHFSAEPYFGMNIAKKADDALINNYHIGMHYGVLGSYEFKPNFKVNLGVGISNRTHEYSQKDTLSVLNSFGFLNGFGIDISGIEETLSQNGIQLDEHKETYGVAKLNQLEIPISMAYTFKDIQIEVGGYVSLLVKSSKKQKVTSDIPALKTIDLDSIENMGLISGFLPQAYSEVVETLNNTDNLNSFNYGVRLGLAYNYKSYLKFYGNYNLDLNNYQIDTDNLLKNSKSFFRVGIAYIIKKVEINEGNLKGRFE